MVVVKVVVRLLLRWLCGCCQAGCVFVAKVVMWLLLRWLCGY